MSHLESYAPLPGDSLREAWVKRFEHGMQRGYASWFIQPATYSRFELPRPGLWRLAPSPFHQWRRAAREGSALVW